MDIFSSGVESIGKMPHTQANTADVYQQLADALVQIQ
jgi:hypothetical protein